MADLLTTRQDESIQARFWDRVDVRGPDECWEWQGYRDRYGYWQVRTESGVKAASRVALLLASNLQRSDLHALHSCDNPPCCNPNHLRWGTPAENSADKSKRGRHRNKAFGGFDNPNCKIAPEALPEIVRLIDEGVLTNGAIGTRFGVTHAMISKIRTGNAWRSQVEAIRVGSTPTPETAA
ncbi:hypothetical protein [Novosphingobium fuchskuhlense]|uniref:hypothetical protein n=1 Tax=Novosphingobium fuchskuhlense TaxID=1117702 RepID=UPI000AFD85B2|nr:hypothetical protein [Novosphingobium fuchskuhlense]